MRKLLAYIYAVCSCVIISSCNLLDSSILIPDKRFEISTEVVWNSEHMAYTIRLGLKNGPEGSYCLDYLIDDDPLSKLRYVTGGEVSSGDEIQLSSLNQSVFIIPTLAPGLEHTAKVVVSRSDISREYILKLKGGKEQDLILSIDNSSVNDFTTITVTHASENCSVPYELTFSIDSGDGEQIRYQGVTFGGAITLDFSKSRSYRFTLPALSPGEHVVSIEARTARASTTISASFEEPIRHYINLVFGFDEATKKMTLRTDYNPDKISFDMSFKVNIKYSRTYMPNWLDSHYVITDRSETNLSFSTTICPEFIEKDVDSGALYNAIDAAHRTWVRNKEQHYDCYSDIDSITIESTIISKGADAGNVPALLDKSKLRIAYTFVGRTWYTAAGTKKYYSPTFSVNGKSWVNRL